MTRVLLGTLVANVQVLMQGVRKLP